MWTKQFWLATLERSVRTAAQAILTALVVGDAMLNAFETNWLNVAGIGAGGFIIGALTCLVAANVGDVGTPSFFSAEKVEFKQ